jgi:hypothetical protein
LNHPPSSFILEAEPNPQKKRRSIVNSILVGSAVAVVALLGIVTYYLVRTLEQARRTALAAEEFLVSARPRIEEATDRLNGILRHTDEVMSTVEQGVAAFSRHRSGAITTVMKAFTTVSAVIAGASQIARLFFKDSPAIKDSPAT